VPEERERRSGWEEGEIAPARRLNWLKDIDIGEKNSF